jgi:hypothetical protein
VIRSGESPVGGATQVEGAASSVYVYAVVRGALPQGFSSRGVGARPAPVRIVEGGGFAAVVSDVPDGWTAAGRADLEAHDGVLSGLVASAALIPMRFGVVMDSDDAVRERLLERHAAELQQLLELLDGRVQMSVKAYYVAESLLRAVLQRHPDLKRRSQALEGRPVEATQNERIALGRDVAQGVEEQRALDERTIVEPLAAVVEDLHVEPLPSERQAASVQVLVDVDRRPELDAVVERLARAHEERFTFRYVGPLPPYSFADLALEEEAS